MAGSETMLPVEGRVIRRLGRLPRAWAEPSAERLYQDGYALSLGGARPRGDDEGGSASIRSG